MALIIKKKSLNSVASPSTLTSEVAQKEADLPVVFPLVALREGVVFPHTESVLVFGRSQSQLALEAAEKTHHYIVVVSQKKEVEDTLTPADLNMIGTLCKVERTLNNDGETHAMLRGLKRVKVTEFMQEDPFFLVLANELPETVTESDEFTAKAHHLSNLFKKTVQAGKPVEFFHFMKLMGGVKPAEMIDHVASTLDLPTAEKQTLLEELNVNERLKAVIDLLSREQHILDIEQKITSKTKKSLDDRMRENILRERMQVIQKELGELADDEEAELNELELKMEKAGLPAEIREKVEKELRRLSQMSAMHSEYAYLHTWIETILSLPWGKRSRGRTSIAQAEKILAKHHYGLEKVKERILEHLAVMQLHAAQKTAQPKPKKNEKPRRKNTSLATLLCFVGPPGVGKTSIGRSIAEALGREFVKVSLGGVHDEAEIRGHRRTYVGALPGRIIQGIAQAKTKNPVFMLDEIDKVGQDFRGDPSSALLEALDPEQNYEFSDHYLGLPFDLSEAIFITTANVLHTIPHALRDRLEVVEYSGYTEDEKFHIAKQYLLDQVQKGGGLKPGQLEVSDAALRALIRAYTREAGVRNLKRELATLARKAARLIAEKKTQAIKVTPKTLETYLGPAKFLDMDQEKSSEIGLVNGLAWTSVGGELLPLEAVLVPGKEGITLTGQLGNVMQESAKAAFTYVRSKAKDLKIDLETIAKHHIHVHAPEGAVPKDGPSAGIAMTTVLASIYTNRPVRKDVAMTGEVTLRGRVLPIGGLKEKLIAAHRAGMKRVFIPKQNLKDLVDVPAVVKKDIEITPVTHVSEVLAIALE